MMDDFLARLHDEKQQLYARLQKLEQFLDCPRPKSVKHSHWLLLKEQCFHMRGYYAALCKRIDDLTAHWGFFNGESLCLVVQKFS